MKPVRRLYVWIAKLGLTALVIACTVWHLRKEFSQFSWADLPASPGYFVASCLLFIAYTMSSSLIWLHLTRLHGVAIGTGRTIAIWCYSIFGKYVPGKFLLWGIRLYLYKRERPEVNVMGLVRCCVLEYLCGIVAAVVLVLGSVAIIDVPVVPANLRTGAAPVFLLGLGLLHPRLMRWLINRLGRTLGLQPDLTGVRSRDVARVLVLCLVNWLVLGFSIFLIARGVHEVAWRHFLFVAASYALAGTIGFLAFFAPSGIGVRETVLIGVLGQIMPLSTATVVAVAARLVSTLGEACSAGGAWLLDRGIRTARPLARRDEVVRPSAADDDSRE